MQGTSLWSRSRLPAASEVPGPKRSRNRAGPLARAYHDLVRAWRKERGVE